MANILTSCDLDEGQIDLHSSMLVPYREANNSIAQTSLLLASRRFVPSLQFHKVNFQVAAVTLRNGSRSNGWYGIKSMLCRIIWHIEKDLLAKRP